jgi:hypothetical protein
MEINEKIMRKVKLHLSKYKSLYVRVQSPHGIMTVYPTYDSSEEVGDIVIVRSWVIDNEIIIIAEGRYGRNIEARRFDLADPKLFNNVAKSIVELIKLGSMSKLNGLNSNARMVSKFLKSLDNSIQQENLR